MMSSKINITRFLWWKIFSFISAILAHRFANDMLLWQPAAPTPRDPMESRYPNYQQGSGGLDLATQLAGSSVAERFGMCKSGLQFGELTQISWDCLVFAVSDNKKCIKKTKDIWAWSHLLLVSNYTWSKFVWLTNFLISLNFTFLIWYIDIPFLSHTCIIRNISGSSWWIAELNLRNKSNPNLYDALFIVGIQTLSSMMHC